MKQAARWSLAATLVVLSAAVAVAGYNLLAVVLTAMETGGSNLPPIVVAEPALSVVDLGLIGVIVILLGMLTGVLARNRQVPGESREAQMVQDMHRGFLEMERRLETLEAALLKRVGSLYVGPRVN